MTKRGAARRGRIPAGYDPDDFPRFGVTVDAVVFTIVEGSLALLLIKRGGEPFAGDWALPGGFKRPDESLDDAVVRELHEETGLAGVERALIQLGAYGDPGRDPRMNVVSVAYVAAVPAIHDVAGGTDAAEAAVIDVAEVVDRRRPLAFDHHRIVTDALARVRRDVTEGDLAFGFLGDTFTMAQVRAVHEAVRGEPLDPANFRRWALARGDLAALGKRQQPGPGGGKPAELFRRAAARAG